MHPVAESCGGSTSRVGVLIRMVPSLWVIGAGQICYTIESKMSLLISRGYL